MLNPRDLKPVEKEKYLDILQQSFFFSEYSVESLFSSCFYFVYFLFFWLFFIFSCFFGLLFYFILFFRNQHFSGHSKSQGLLLISLPPVMVVDGSCWWPGFPTGAPARDQFVEGVAPLRSGASRASSCELGGLEEIGSVLGRTAHLKQHETVWTMINRIYIVYMYIYIYSIIIHIISFIYIDITDHYTVQYTQPSYMSTMHQETSTPNTPAPVLSSPRFTMPSTTCAASASITPMASPMDWFQEHLHWKSMETIPSGNLT